MPHRSFAAAALVWGVASGSPVGAAHVDGEGTIDTNLPPPLESVITEYEDPQSLDVAKSVQLDGSPGGGSIPVGNKVLSYSGQAQFGRLAATSHIGGQVPSSPDLSTSVSVRMGFHDQIAPQNLNPLSGNYWRLDVELSGEMTGYGATDMGASVGKLTNSLFSIGLGDVAGTFTTGLAIIEFTWVGDDFVVTNTSTDSPPRFVPYPGEEPRFTPSGVPGPPRYLFGARGYVDVPLDEEFLDEEENPLIAFGDPFLFFVTTRATSSCGNEIPECLATTDFSNTARIDNARIVDQNGDPVAGASFTSTSGYDYITSPVPEPQPALLTLVAGAALAIRAARRSRWAARARP